MSSFSKCIWSTLLLVCVSLPFSPELWAHPMDSYAIDQYLDFKIQGDQVHLIHRIEFAEIPTASELPLIDSDRNMVLSSAETIPYVEKTVTQLLKEIVLTIDGQASTWQYLRGEAFLDTIPSTRLKMVSEYQTNLSADLGDGKLFRFDLRHRPTARGDRQTRIVTQGKTALEGVASSENIQPPGMAPPSIHPTAALVYGHKVQWTVIPSKVEAPEEIPDFSIRSATGPVAPENPFLSLNNRDLGGEIMGETGTLPMEGPSGDEPSAVSLRDEGAPTFAEGAETKATKETWADQQFRQMFLDSKAGKAGLGALLGFTLLSLLYGGAHALEPGHGKTVVAAYLVGSHGTVFHAVLLALIVTFTHTFSVYILGIVALTNLEKVQGTYLPILECGSWFLILCMGVWLFLKYYKYYVQGKLADPTFHTHGFGEGHTHLPDGSHPHDHDHDHDHGHAHPHPHPHNHGHPHPHDHDHPHNHGHPHEGAVHRHTHEPAHAEKQSPTHEHSHDHPHPHTHDHPEKHTHSHAHKHDEGHSHSHPHPHDHPHPHEHGPQHSHDHDHGHPHTHSHDHAHGHSHGHPPHPHEKRQSTEVSFWNLLALGVTGGIVPCPGALFVMMIALTSGAVWTGLYLITVFSVGLALTLMAVGITVVKGRGVIDKYSPNPTIIQIVPIFTSLLIAFVGLGFLINGLVKHGIIQLNL